MLKPHDIPPELHPLFPAQAKRGLGEEPNDRAIRRALHVQGPLRHINRIALELRHQALAHVDIEGIAQPCIHLA